MNKKILEDLLNDTDGEMIYCEQLLTVLYQCGFTPEESDCIRKCYAKKKKYEIEKWEKLILYKVGEELSDIIIGNIRRNISEMRYQYQI